MTKEDLKIIRSIDPEQADLIETDIKESYEPTRKVKFANFINTILYYLGFLIGITIFQAMTSMTYHTERKFTKAGLISFLGLNIFFFLYFGEDLRYAKYYVKKLEKSKYPHNFEKIKKGLEKVSKLSREDLEILKDKMLTTIATPNVSKYETLGIVYGSSVKSANFFKDISAATKSVGGGKILAYKSLMNQTRNDALSDLVKNSIKEFDNCDLICNVRLENVQISGTSSEILAYGTAIKIIKK